MLDTQDREFLEAKVKLGAREAADAVVEQVHKAVAGAITLHVATCPAGKKITELLLRQRERRKLSKKAWAAILLVVPVLTWLLERVASVVMGGGE